MSLSRFRTETIGDARGTWIYGLSQGPNGPVRYVGKTSRYLYQRHKQHLTEARKGRPLPVCRWLAKISRLPNTIENAFSIRAIEYVSPGADWAARERFWIEEYRQRGASLLNLTAGGEGLSGHSHGPEAREKIAVALRTGGTFACEVCGTTFWRKRNEIKKGHARFCSRRCSNARHKGAGLFQ